MQRNLFRAFLLGSSMPAMLLLAHTDALAQAITGGLHAQITGNGGTPVAGASVKVTSEDTGASLNATTDANGSFTLSSLSVQSDYTVSVSAAGYDTKTISHVGLTLGSTANLNIDMSEAKAETVTVTGQRAAAAAITESAGVATSFSIKDIKNTPTVERDIRDIVQNTPYAYIDPVGGGSNPPIPTVNIAGANPRCNNFLVDGLQQKDSFGLNSTGYPTTRAPIPTDWAAQVQVAVTPYDVQYNDTCGGVINVVTKSGTNELHGTAYGYMKNDGLNGQDYNLFNNATGTSSPTNSTNRPVKPYFDEKSYGGTLSGSIIPDTLFFFVGYDELKRSSAPSGIAVGPQGSGFATTATTISLAEVNKIVQDAQTVYGFNAGNLLSNYTEYNQRYIGKLTWQINDDHSLTGVYQHAAGAQLVVGSGVSTASSPGPRISLPSNWYTNSQKMEVYNLQETGRWTQNLTTEVSIGHEGVRELPTPLDGLNFPEVYVRTPGGDNTLGTTDDGYVRLGPDFSRQYNFLYYRNDYAKALATYTMDEHTIEAGFEFHELHVDDKFVQGAQAVVRFDSESDFANRIISTQNLTSSSGINASTSNAQGNPIYFATGIGGNPGTADGVFSYSIASVFAQDTWYPIKDMTVLAGLRYDRYAANPNGIVVNPYFQQRYGFANNLTLNGLDAVLPRFSVTYNMEPDQDFVPGTLVTLRGGVGMFSGGFQNVWVTNDYDTNGINLLNVTGTPGVGTFASVPTLMPTDHNAFIQSLINGPLASATTVKTSSVDAQLPSFKLPRNLRMNAGFDMFFGDGLLGPNWQMGFDYLSMNAYDSPFWTNLRLMKTGGTAPDGRALYILKYDGTANKDPVTGGALTGSDYGMGSVNGGNSTLFITSLKNSWKDTGFGDFNITLSYTHDRTTDVQSATSSTASSNYNNIARVNFNDPEVGRSDYEREHRISLNINVVEKFFGDLETRFNIFGQRLSGQHYSLNFNPSGNPFIVNAAGTNANIASGARSLLYVPKADPTTGLVTATSDPLVTYAAGFDFASFNAILKQTGALKYAGGIAPRNAFSGPWSSLVNLSVEQELAGFDDTHRLVFTGDIYNVLNLINPAWGATTSAVFYQADPLVSATIVNGKYVYSTPQTVSSFNSFTFQTQRASSTYQIQFGVRYEF
jgi:outer membrane receptor protein involved in Fe transport